MEKGDALYNRITGQRYEVKGFFTFVYADIKGPLTVMAALKKGPLTLFVEFVCGHTDTYANAISNLYMREEEYNYYIKSTQKWDEKDLVPSPLP